jgi:uncharacterized protein involved in exopolysaccharide biosynthesis
MRRWIWRAANLYPQVWRERYGVEFEALLEDIKPGWRELTDILRGALTMQMTNATTYLKLAGGLAMAGAIAATAVSFTVPGRYVSSAVIQMTEQQDSLRPASKEALDERLAVQLEEFEQEMLSNNSLEETIQSLDLYKAERRRMPMGDVAEQMRSRDLQIHWMTLPSAKAAEPVRALRIAFAYPDKEKARAVVDRLVTGFALESRLTNKSRERTWQQVWQDISLLSRPVPGAGGNARTGSFGAAPPGEAVEVLHQASLPENDVTPNRLVFVAYGLGSGLLLGLLTAFMMRRPKWGLKIAGFAAAGCALAVAMSFLIPNIYTSSAVLRFRQPTVPDSLSVAQRMTPWAERMRQMQRDILSRSSLEEIIQAPQLDLYRKQRTQPPLADIVEKMRNDIGIQMLNAPGAPGGGSAFRISFTYPDRNKAQAVVRELVTRFTEQNVRLQRAKAKESGDAIVWEIEEHKAGMNLEVLDPTSLPEVPVGPNRLGISALGLGLGLLLGALTLWFRQNRGQKLRAWVRNLRRRRFGAGSVGVKSRLKAGCSQDWLPHLGK